MDASCREVLRDLERYLDGEGPDQFQTEIARHLADCHPCLTRSDFERALRAIVARHCREPAPPRLVNDVLQLLR